MKIKAILGFMALLVSANAYAAPAMHFKCVGLNRITEQAVVFDVALSEYDRDFGYANQSIRMSFQGAELKKEIAMQMTGANKKNECKRNSMGEINVLVQGFDLGAEDEVDQSSKVTLKTKCAGGFNLVGTCVRNY